MSHATILEFFKTGIYKLPLDLQTGLGCINRKGS